MAESDPDPVVRLAAARTALAQRDMSAFEVLVALLEVEDAPGLGDEDCRSIRSLAGQTLRDATGRDPEPPTAHEWRALLPSIAMQFVTQRLDYVPARLDGFR